MNGSIIFITLLLSSFFAKAQDSELDSLWNVYIKTYKTEGVEKPKSPYDTLYFNKQRNDTSGTAVAYYRIVYPIDSFYIINDYYRNGTLKMEALCSLYWPGTFHGACIYYYPTGILHAKGQYLFNEPVGTWYYYNKKGRFTKTIIFSSPEIQPYDSTSIIPQNQSSLFIGNISYRTKLNKGVLNSGHGFSLEAGINPGYFISQKLLLGVFVGWAMRDILYSTTFEQSYQNDVNANFNGTSMSGNDSMVVNYMVKMMSQNRTYHEKNVYYGIAIKLPYKYMPVVKIYRGTSSYAYKESGEPIQPKPYVPAEKKYDNYYFDIIRKMNWGLEVFLYNGITKVRNYQGFTIAEKKKLRWSTNLLALSLYIEEFDTYHTRFTFSDGYHNVDVPMTSFMNSSFMNAHRKEYSVGMRLSCGVF